MFAQVDATTSAKTQMAEYVIYTTGIPGKINNKYISYNFVFDNIYITAKVCSEGTILHNFKEVADIIVIDGFVNFYCIYIVEHENFEMHRTL